MRKTLILAAVAALALTSVADAKTCTDPKTHKFVKCPAAAAVTPAKAASTPMAAPAKAGGTATAAAATSGGPHCTKGKPCGHSCIKMSDVCHK